MTDIRRDSNMAALQRRLRMSQARAAARAANRTVRAEPPCSTLFFSSLMCAVASARVCARI